MNRRQFLKLTAAGGLYFSFGLDTSPTSAKPPSSILEPWRPGTLDIHHLAYGRGSSTFILGPDGTTLLIDAGTTPDSVSLSCAQHPNTGERPGEWIASYILRQMRPAGRAELDFALITHIHPDHLGDPGQDSPLSSTGEYHLTGIADVDARVPITTLIDRCFPGYDYPAPLDTLFARNYIDFVKSRISPRKSTERIKVGSADQIRLLRNPKRYPDFKIRNLAANGEVWTGVDQNTRRLFPDLRSLEKSDYPTENMCSIAIRLSYGRFDYFTGGDLTSDTEESGEPWRDIETPVANAAGPVEVAVANHHGYFDAVGPNFVKALRPQVFVIPAWYVAHPAILPLRRMLSQHIYDGDREVYATCVMEANRAVNNQFIGKLKSTEGHIIVRVAPGGEQFQVIVTDNSNDSDTIKLISSPHRCR